MVDEEEWLDHARIVQCWMVIHFHALILWSTPDFLLLNRPLTWRVFYVIHQKHFIGQMPTETACFNVFSTGNLLNSHSLCRYCTCAKEQKHAFQNKTKVDGQVFNTFHIKRSWFHALFKYWKPKTISFQNSRAWNTGSKTQCKTPV